MRRPQSGRYLDWLKEERGSTIAGYEELWRWSVDDLEGFWGSLWDFFEIRGAHAVRAGARLARDPGAEWFAGLDG